MEADRGTSILEVLAVLTLLAVALAIGSGALAFLGRQSATVATARLTVTAIDQARMLSVYRGVSHFVVLGPADRSLAIFEDSSAPYGSFDSGDSLVSAFYWPGSVSLALPIGGPSLADPLLDGNLTQAWSLPLPDSSARWGTELRGVMVTPRGTIMSAESIPQPIGVGTVVFDDHGAATTAVAINGRAGAVFAFGLREGSWGPL